MDARHVRDESIARAAAGIMTTATGRGLVGDGVAVVGQPLCGSDPRYMAPPLACTDCIRPNS
jgi:hypothetical protein